ncbi:hypothetical protein CIK68_13020 [Brachybacterium alimentarium]|nr:hypothetical protein CIK68_13020 [Brachybacterium alimentarium]
MNERSAQIDKVASLSMARGRQYSSDEYFFDRELAGEVIDKLYEPLVFINAINYERLPSPWLMCISVDHRFALCRGSLDIRIALDVHRVQHPQALTYETMESVAHFLSQTHMLAMQSVLVAIDPGQVIDHLVLHPIRDSSFTV